MQQAMRIMVSAALAILGMARAVSAAEGPDTAELNRMLNECLAGASVNDAAAHDRFWAEDLIYTSSNGERFGKAEIMQGLSAHMSTLELERARLQER